MTQPKVSVIIPAYNQADYLGEAIQSVLDQTYRDIEVIIVNDASPDHTDEVVKQFNDSRIKYIVHQENRMLSAARNTGIRASTGEIIALLDADDLFHPEKLQAHVDFLEKHPEIGVTYNARFDIADSIRSILQLWRPPLVANLADLILGFPFAPSDMVLRRDWIFRVNLFDESFTMFSEDLDINCRLALAGCQFASVNRALNYRRVHPGRFISNIPGRIEAHLRTLETAFADPKCPAHVLALRDKAYINKYLAWACFAFGQNETALGQAYICEAVRLAPTILKDELSNLLLNFTIMHGGVDYEIYFNRIFAQVPAEFVLSSEQYKWTLAHGYLLKAIQVVMWDQYEDGSGFFAQANKLGVKIDEDLIQQLAYQLLSYEIEFGSEPALALLKKLEPYLEKMTDQQVIRRLTSLYLLNGAFKSYQAGEYAQVPAKVIRAITNDPSYLTNRGILSILFRSIAVGIWSQPSN